MNKLILILSLAVLLSAPVAHAEVSAVRTEVKVNANAEMHSKATTSARSSQNGMRSNSEAYIKATSSASTTAHVKAEEHRSIVATFVRSLLSAADRDRGIGAEVRAVAQSQNDSASTTVEAISKVEKRGGLVRFLIGTDWKSAGEIRSHIATTKADIARLEKARDNTTDASVRADLTAQINALKDEQDKLEDFVNDNEDRFSLFGWFVKLFVKADVK